MSAETLLQTKLRISVVDDDESVRKALGRLLSSLDYQAETFDSGGPFLIRWRTGALTFWYWTCTCRGSAVSTFCSS